MPDKCSNKRKPESKGSKPQRKSGREKPNTIRTDEARSNWTAFYGHWTAFYGPGLFSRIQIGKHKKFYELFHQPSIKTYQCKSKFGDWVRLDRNTILDTNILSPTRELFVPAARKRLLQIAIEPSELIKALAVLAKIEAGEL
jgi:hypothetical protein